MRIKINRGLAINLGGVPEPVIDEGRAVASVAVLGSDFVGLKPRMLVQVGDTVNLGQPLFFDKRDPEVMYTAPGAGRVVAINRGARRALQSVVIELDESTVDSGLSQNFDSDSLRAGLCKSGLWTAFRTRPFGKVPQSDSTPRSIFVTAIDTQPLAADPKLVIESDQEGFLHGLKLIAQLCDANVFLCTGSDWGIPSDDIEKVRRVEFSGPHPAGLPGTHIHHLDPVSADRTVWHIGYQDVMAIGRTELDGRLSTTRTVALGGDGFQQPRLVRTRAGANIDDLLAGQLGAGETPPRLISGSVLSGRTAVGPQAYIGRYHTQITAIPDRASRRLFGWFGFSGLFRRSTGSTAQHGRPAALVPVGAFDEVMPLDMLPIPLLRALLIRDTDQAQALGCLELDAEDLALCSFVCPGKTDYGAVLRMNLEQIEREG